jgi:hypothetical protein
MQPVLRKPHGRYHSTLNARFARRMVGCSFPEMTHQNSSFAARLGALTTPASTGPVRAEDYGKNGDLEAALTLGDARDNRAPRLRNESDLAAPEHAIT